MSAPVAGAASVNARSLAVHAVARVLQEGITLDQALGAALAAPPHASAAIRSLSYGAVRGYFRHEAVLGRLLSQPMRALSFPVRALLSVALFELEDARTPEYAVLRRYLRERRTLDEEVARSPAARHASPGWLAERLRLDWPDRWTELLAALDARAPMWLRADRRRTSADGYVETLRAAEIPARA